MSLVLSTIMEVDTSSQKLVTLPSIKQEGEAGTSFEYTQSIENPFICEETALENGIRNNLNMVQEDNAKIDPKQNSGRKDAMKRLCIYCGKMKTDLTRHIRSVHKTEPEVKEIFNLQNKKDIILAFRKLRKAGIAKQNEERFRRGSSPICMRKQNPSTEKVICLNCKGVYSKKCLFLHKRSCLKPARNRNGTGYISVNELKPICLEKDIQDFKRKIIDKLLLDNIGRIIINEPMIQLIGNATFEKMNNNCSEHLMQQRVLAHMRRVATLIWQVNCERVAKGKNELAFENLFIVSNYPEIKSAMENLIKNGKSLKSGYGKLLNSSIKISCDALIVNYIMTGQKRKQNEVVEFLAHYSKNDIEIVGVLKVNKFLRKFPDGKTLTIQHNLTPRHNSSRRHSLMMKEYLLLKRKIINFHSYILSELEIFLDSSITLYKLNFVRLRRAVICQITFFNCLRPEEVDFLTVEEWKKAKENAYITTAEFETLNDAQKSLINQFRIIYSAHGNNATVSSKQIPILIPKYCYEALEKLADDENRNAAQILPENKYLFPNTGNIAPISSYSDIKQCCNKVNLKKNLCSDQLRHYASAAFWDLEVNKEIMKSFFGHEDQKEEIINVTQIPNVLKTILDAGPILNDIHSRISIHCQGISNRDAVLDPAPHESEALQTQSQCTDGDRILEVSSNGFITPEDVKDIKIEVEESLWEDESPLIVDRWPQVSQSYDAEVKLEVPPCNITTTNYQAVIKSEVDTSELLYQEPAVWPLVKEEGHQEPAVWPLVKEAGHQEPAVWPLVKEEGPQEPAVWPLVKKEGNLEPAVWIGIKVEGQAGVNFGESHNLCNPFACEETVFNNEAEFRSSLKREKDHAKIYPQYNFFHKNIIYDLYSFLLAEFDSILGTTAKLEKKSFVGLRRAVVCRLTFFNGLHPSKVGLLTLEEWKLAKEYSYITQAQLDASNDCYKALLDQIRIVYCINKVTSKKFPVLVPKSCFEALDKLCEDQSRVKAQIHPYNKYLFPNTGVSMDPISGHNDIAACWIKARMKKNLSADKLRLYASAEFRNLEISEEMKQFFDRSNQVKDISEMMNHVPKPLRTVLEIASILRNIDE